MTIPGISEIPVLSTLKYQVHMSSHSVLTPHFSEISNNIYASFYLVFQRNERRFWGSNQLNHFLKEHITRLEMYLPQSVSINWFQSNKFCQPLECHKKTFELSFILLNLLANCQVLSFFHVWCFGMPKKKPLHWKNQTYLQIFGENLAGRKMEF